VKELVYHGAKEVRKDDKPKHEIKDKLAEWIQSL
jgi:hypothetical protein